MNEGGPAERRRRGIPHLRSPRGLRILFLTQTYPRFPEDASGPFIRDLARGLVAGGDAVTVLVPHAAGVPARWEDDGIEVHSFRYAPQRWELVGYSRTLDSDETLRLGAALASPLYALGARLAVARALRGDHFDLLHAHWVVPNGWVALPCARRLPLLVGLHGSDVFLAERFGVRALVRRTLARSRGVTGCSPELVARVLALVRRPPPGSVIPYGVDAGRFFPQPGRRSLWRGRLGIPAEAPLLLSVGRMVTKKGFHVLLDALPTLLAEHPALHVVLAGGGDLLTELQARAAAWRGRIHFPGTVLRDTLPDLYRAADGFVLPAVHDSKGNVDGLPNVILEAMASGLPVVASGISGIPLAVRDGQEGLLLPEGDAGALCGALARLLADPALRRRLGESAHRRAVADLSWRAVADRYREAYVAALGRERAA